MTETRTSSHDQIENENPFARFPLAADDLVVMHRPSRYGKTDYQPLEEPIAIDLGGNRPSSNAFL